MGFARLDDFVAALDQFSLVVEKIIIGIFQPGVVFVVGLKAMLKPAFNVVARAPGRQENILPPISAQAS